jgi:hypothetical protein
MGAESTVVLGAEAANFFFDGWELYVTPNDGIWNIPRSVRSRRRAFDGKRSRISILDVEAAPHSWMP